MMGANNPSPNDVVLEVVVKHGPVTGQAFPMGYYWPRNMV